MELEISIEALLIKRRIESDRELDLAEGHSTGFPAIQEKLEKRFAKGKILYG